MSFFLPHLISYIRSVMYDAAAAVIFNWIIPIKYSYQGEVNHAKINFISKYLKMFGKCTYVRIFVLHFKLKIVYFFSYVYTFFLPYTLVVSCVRVSGNKPLQCCWISISRAYTTIPYLTIRHAQTVGVKWPELFRTYRTINFCNRNSGLEES